MPGLGLPRSEYRRAERLAAIAAAPREVLGAAQLQELREVERHGLGYEAACTFRTHTARQLAQEWQEFCYDVVNRGAVCPTFEEWLFKHSSEDRVAYNRRTACEELLAAYLDLPEHPLFPSDWLLAEADRFKGLGA